MARTSATVLTGASVTPRAMPPSNSSIFVWRIVNSVITARTSASWWTSASDVSIRASYVVQSSASAHSWVTTPLSSIHGISPTSRAPVAMRQTSPSAQG